MLWATQEKEEENDKMWQADQRMLEDLGIHLTTV